MLNNRATNAVLPPYQFDYKAYVGSKSGLILAGIALAIIITVYYGVEKMCTKTFIQLLS